MLILKDKESYLYRLADPCQFTLGLLLSLSMRNLFGLLYWNILFNDFIVFCLFYCKIWTSKDNILTKELGTQNIFN